MGSRADAPNDVVDIGFFSTEVLMVYTDDGLFFTSKSEGRIPLSELDLCQP